MCKDENRVSYLCLTPSQPVLLSQGDYESRTKAETRKIFPCISKHELRRLRGRTISHIHSLTHPQSHTSAVSHIHNLTHPQSPLQPCLFSSVTCLHPFQDDASRIREKTKYGDNFWWKCLSGSS